MMQEAVVAHRVAELSTEHSDSQLVLWAQADPVAFGDLYRRYRDRVYRYARTRTTNDEDAEDLTQQIFTRALDGLYQYNPNRGPFAAWLFAIVRNTLANFHQRRHLTVPYDLLPERLHPTGSLDPLSETLRREDAERLAEALQALDPGKRELLLLRFVADLTVGEIAQVVGKREAATRKQLGRTLRALAAQFEGDHQ